MGDRRDIRRFPTLTLAQEPQNACRATWPEASPHGTHPGLGLTDPYERVRQPLGLGQLRNPHRAVGEAHGLDEVQAHGVLATLEGHLVVG